MGAELGSIAELVGDLRLVTLHVNMRVCCKTLNMMAPRMVAHSWWPAECVTQQTLPGLVTTCRSSSRGYTMVSNSPWRSYASPPLYLASALQVKQFSNLSRCRLGLTRHIMPEQRKDGRVLSSLLNFQLFVTLVQPLHCLRQTLCKAAPQLLVATRSIGRHRQGIAHKDGRRRESAFWRRARSRHCC